MHAFSPAKLQRCSCSSSVDRAVLYTQPLNFELQYLSKERQPLRLRAGEPIMQGLRDGTSDAMLKRAQKPSQGGIANCHDMAVAVHVRSCAGPSLRAAFQYPLYNQKHQLRLSCSPTCNPRFLRRTGRCSSGGLARMRRLVKVSGGGRITRVSQRTWSTYYYTLYHHGV